MKDPLTKSMLAVAKSLSEHAKRIRKLEVKGSPVLVFDSEPPTIPTGVAATAVSYHLVSIVWSASVDNVGVAGYSVYRDGVMIGTTSSTLYNDYTVTGGNSYVYTVDAFDFGGNYSELSSSDTVVTPAEVDITPPTTPSGLTYTSLSPTSITIIWNASSDNVGVSGYTVYKNGVPTVLTPNRSYTDNGLVPNTSYTFTVDAYDAAGNHSGQSSTLVVNTPSPPVQDTWYVATDGLSTNTGAYDSPISLDDALNGGHTGAITAGSTIYLLDGTHTLTSAQVVTGLAGSAGSPISIMPYPGARPRIRNNSATPHHTLSLRTISYLDFYDIEFTGYNYTRAANGAGATAAYHVYENPSYTQSHINFYNCKFHDSAGMAVSFSIGSTAIVYDGCMFYYNGSASDYDWTMHLVSTNGNTKTIRNCIFINNAADDIRVYSSDSTAVNDIVIDDNIIVNCGSLYANPSKSIMIAAPTAIPDNISVTGNATYCRLTTESLSRSIQIGHTDSGTPGSVDDTTCETDGRWSADELNYSNSAGINQVGFAASTYFSSWFGWNSVTVPQGATITSAYIRVYVQNSEASTASMLIHAHDADTGTAPTTAADAIAKTRTTAEVSWVINNWSIGQINSPDISSVVQEIVDRAGWASGNNMVFFFDENGGNSTNDIYFATRDHATDPEAELHITYTTGSADSGVSNINVQSNTFIGQPVDADGINYTNVSLVGNTAIYDGSHTGNTQTRWPGNTWTAVYPSTGTSIYFRAHDWNTRYASVMIINWAGSTTATITAASMTGLTIDPGDSYLLCNAENYYSDRIAGVFDGVSITVPMTGHSMATPTGGVAQPATLFPYVGVFQMIVYGEGGGGGDTTPPSVPLNLNATGTAGDVDLTWDASTDASGMKEYRVYRNGTFLATVPHNSGTVSSGTNGDPVPGVGDYYVSTSGLSTNDGSSANPWSLAYAMSGAEGTIVAGDTIWIRGGTYSVNLNVNVSGSSGNPVRFIAYTDERPIINSTTTEGSTFTLQNVQYVEFWNLEFSWQTVAARATKDDTVQPNGACIQDETSIVKYGVKFYGCFFRNAYGQGFRSRPVDRCTWEGCHFYYNGGGRFDHGLYIWNQTPYTKVIRSCLFHHNAGHDIHGYNTSASMSEDWMSVYDNLFWQTGGLYSVGTGRSILLGDDAGSTNNNIVTGNRTYSNITTGSYNQAIKVGYPTNGWSDNLITGNRFAGQAIDFASTPRDGNTVTGNYMYGCTSYGDSQAAYPDNTWASMPTSGSQTFVKAYTYNTQKGNIAIYNWGSAAAVTVTHAELATTGGIDIATGDIYVLHNAENYFGDEVTAEYDGVSISIAMTGHTMETPVGVATPTARTGFPIFGAFVLEVFKSGSTTPPAQTYTDTTAALGFTYTYQVSAVDVYDNISGLSVGDTISLGTSVAGSPVGLLLSITRAS